MTSQLPHFRTTRWTLVVHAAASDTRGRAALEVLCKAYWYPLYALARRRGLSPADAEDSVQGFFADLLARGDVGQAIITQRTYEEFTGDTSWSYLDDEREEGEADLVSVLEGMSVLFIKQRDDSIEVSAADDAEIESAILDTLEPAQFFEFLLNGPELSEGDEWTLEPEHMHALAFPAGDLRQVIEEDLDEEFIPIPKATYAGEIQMTLSEYEEVDGVRLARLTLAIDVGESLDLLEYEAKLLQQADDEYDEEIEVDEVRESTHFTGTGEVYWNLEEQRLQSYTLEVELEELYRSTLHEDGESYPSTETSSSTGEVRVEVQISALE